MKILVTGGAGFIGSHLVRALLSDGADVAVLDRVPREDAWRLRGQSPTYHCVDVTDRLSVAAAVSEYQVVFHLAGLLGTDSLLATPHDAVLTNVIGTLNVLDAARESGAKLVNVSLIPDWNNSYMITKQAASKFCLMYHREFGMQTVDLRLSHVYGPGQLWAPVRKLIPSLLHAGLLNAPIQLYGTGEQLLDLIYVDDAVAAIRRAAYQPLAVGRTIEIGTGLAHTLTSVVQTVLQITEGNAAIEHRGRRPGEPEDENETRAANVSDQIQILGIRPNADLSDGIRTTMYWMRKYLEESQA